MELRSRPQPIAPAPPRAARRQSVLLTGTSFLHLPAELRPAIAAEPGHVLVRADLGQIEPRVLAVLSGDPALTQATRGADLYAPVAARLGVDRPTAKIAVLAAMYGQTSGAAGRTLESMKQAYPAAIAFLDAAYESGRAIRPCWGLVCCLLMTMCRRGGLGLEIARVDPGLLMFDLAFGKGRSCMAVLGMSWRCE